MTSVTQRMSDFLVRVYTDPDGGESPQARGGERIVTLTLLHMLTSTYMSMLMIVLKNSSKTSGDDQLNVMYFIKLVN